MEVTGITPKPSFFDDNLENFQLWEKTKPLQNASEVRLLEGLLLKKNSCNEWKSYQYVLFEDRLACYKNGPNGEEHSYCLIQNMRLEKISIQDEREEKHGIRLTHNLQYCDLYMKTKEQHERWISTLTSFCVLTSYSSNFVNIKVIGKGSFAKVYLVKRKSNNTDLAVKTFDKNLLLKESKAKSSLINEINIMRGMTHDNIIKLHEVYESNNHIYLVQELLNGGELFDRIIKKGQYSEKDACVLMKKLLSALAFMHSKGVMHRDIKPENLILKDLENDWNIKIADFGLATKVNLEHSYLFKRCGTPGYVAPEVLADEKYDSKVDVFSAGVILYILLTGSSPFYGKSYNEILWKNKNCEISFEFEDKGLMFSDYAHDLLKKMLARNPAERISAEQALQHEWMILDEVNMEPQPSHYLCSAQENMKKFQEENRFNVKNIKPKDLHKSDLEKSGHAPSPLLNGKVISMADSSKNPSCTNSPDLKRASGVSQKSKFVEPISPYIAGSLNVGRHIGSLSSTVDESDDIEGILDEQNTILETMGKYKNGFTLISQIKDNSSSNNSSTHNTPIMTRGGDSLPLKKVQEHLLGYVKTLNDKPSLETTAEHKKKTEMIKDNLKQLH